MDYTPISVRRVLLAFAITVLVAIGPVLTLGLGDISSVLSSITSIDCYGGLVLGLGSIAVAAALIGLTWLAFAFGRRADRRPSRV